MANSKDYRVRLGKLARELAMDQHGRVRAWHLERAIEDLQNKPVEQGEEQLRILKEQLVEFNVQLKTANTVIAIIVSELTKNHDCSLKHIDRLSETLQLEAAKRSNLKIDRISKIRGKNWNWYSQPYEETKK